MSDHPTIQMKYIPLSKLHEGGNNPRRTMDPAAMAELEASIASHGLLQSLVVKEVSGDKFNVEAGIRRLRALKKLAEARVGNFTADFMVMCGVLAPSASPAEVALAENIVREQMHPMDQCLAFKALLTKKETPSAIAARFGVTETVVKKRLKLANLSPQVIDAFRAGEIDLERAQAFTVSDDHARQEKLLKDIRQRLKNGYYVPDSDRIRQELTAKQIPATDKRVKFVGLKAYEEAGGEVIHDLFTDGSYITDVKLLDKLVEQQLKAEQDKIKAQGWGWVEIRPDIDHYQIRHKEGMNQIEPTKTVPPPKENKDRIAVLKKELEALEKSSAGREEYTDDEYNRKEAINAEIDQLEQRQQIFDPGVQQTAGVILTVGRNGQIEAQAGWVKKKDQKEAKAAAKKSAKGAGGKKPAAEKKADTNPFSQNLCTQLTNHKTAAIAAVLALKTDVALAAVVHTLGIEVFYDGDNESDLKIEISQHHYPEDVTDKGCRAAETLDKLGLQWQKMMPKDSDDFLQWCLNQPRETLLEVLAFCAAVSFSAVVGHFDPSEKISEQYGSAIGAAVGVDVSAWFTPTADNYFDHVSSAKIHADLKEALKMKDLPSEWLKLKKGDLAKLAEKEIKERGAGWIPEPLRVPVPKQSTASVKAIKQAEVTRGKMAKAAAGKAAKPAAKKKAA